MELLGIDNVFFEVGDILQAIEFYETLGLEVKSKILHFQAALFKIGNESSGLMIVQKKKVNPSRLWLEVENAEDAQADCKNLKINGNILETFTGLTFEIIDPWGNVIGFADYSKKPELARREMSTHVMTRASSKSRNIEVE